MSNKVWYIHQEDKQMGPFEAETLLQLRDNNIISQNAFVFKAGWADWRPVKTIWVDIEAQALGKPAAVPELAVEEKSAERRGEERANVSGRIIAHNGSQVVFASAVNVSENGLYIATNEEVFHVGEEIKITVQIEQLDKSFNATARVAHFNSNPEFIKGYGLIFKDVNRVMTTQIKDLITNKPQAI